ncbi:MAG: tRNA (adenosine(37)-N6)-dimethylallyltransferase MiaA [Actinomycetota bacterium]|nr:tRNA (adenosine(37)-N6)-dimethylallyltransferase MiaA [Actinomycetota bacterium]
MVGWGAPREVTSLPDVIAVFGPTASGKSAVSEALATRLGTEVVSADALQVYRGLPILTNQPQSPTRLVAITDLSNEMSVGSYAVLAHGAVDELVQAKGIAVVTGGTGLYFRAALVDLGVPGPSPAETRARVEASYDSDPAATYARLAKLDAPAANVVHPNDRRRVVRALELAESGGSLVPEQDRLWSEEVRRPTLVVGLELSRGVLEARIRTRTQDMFRRGVVEEVRRARAGHVSRVAEKALGLADIAALSPEEAFERIVVRTRRYAAYQRKWMRRIPGIVMIDGDRTPTEVADAILEVAGAR